MDNTKQQLVDRIKSASNVLVTVSRNPSVDALSALLGLTLVLNKQNKHAAAVFSGQVPSTIEFLQPEETIEKNTDSLRDFIIALDKNKADKLRYKVEDNVVRIFITPYKTSISQEDFEFSEGDFNIDVVIALGVRQQEDLDDAITAHGRILHDATVASINTMPDAGLGSINWYEPQASSLSELVTELAQLLGPNLLDEQISTALLTGIIAETERFSNDKTSSVTMSMSAALMKAGANQQLVASKLDEQLITNADISDQSNGDTNQSMQSGDTSAGDQSASQDDGAIQIDHSKPPASDSTPATDDTKQAISPATALNVEAQPPIIDPLDTTPVTENTSGAGNLTSGPKLMTEPPVLGGTLTANSVQPGPDPVTDPLSLPNSDRDKLLERNGPGNIKAPDLAPTSAPSQPQNAQPITQPATTPTLTPPPTNWSPPPTPTPLATTPVPDTEPIDDSKIDDKETLAELEKAVGSPHIPSSPTVEEARDEVKKAYSETSASDNDVLPAIDALGAQPLGGELHAEDNTDTAQPSQGTESSTPPPVPPPIPFQFGNPTSS